ncbi:sensor domain-containing diguanylate cyclase [Neobacillus sp. OS1-2]|uniref:sensor domain-containing diguanylate cyclase n=1 Tax=Neobacillus sp. OS1-2 TaxID=3070680 RepID=UPI0027E10966|nr:sensor domain-containing diguanylate cyclase [Neobacillus sp. OS1-2]WML40854.1 sensor domain-containing diguanylate cyclase [Neobacillus sp. OS1-2]
MFDLEGDLLLDVVKYKKLFQITERLHSFLDVDVLLGELFIVLKEIYPNFSYQLLLSMDTYSHNDLPIIDLEYDGENIAAIQAFESGAVQFESTQTGHAVLYAPLKGKREIYGVLQVIAPLTKGFPIYDVEFMALLSSCAGGALENAQLYQLSLRTISDLQLINETSHQLNSNRPMAETFEFMSTQIKASFEANEVGFFLFSQKQTKAKILPGSTPYFFTRQARVYVNHIIEKLQKENEPLFIGDFTLPEKNHGTSFHSIMAVPVVVGERLRGFCMIMHHCPYFFTFESFTLLQSLVHHTSLALTNSMLREELKIMVTTDHLTKLHSRKFLDEKIQCSMKNDEEGTFILLDIDNFKEINDTYGHQIGDEVLIQVANLIRGNMREHDIGARWGGEELAIYLPKVPLDTGAAIACRLVKKVAKRSKPHITVSCGVSYWNKESKDSYQSLFKRADEALYTAKETGKNKVVIEGNHSRVNEALI